MAATFPDPFSGHELTSRDPLHPEQVQKEQKTRLQDFILLVKRGFG